MNRANNILLNVCSGKTVMALCSVVLALPCSALDISYKPEADTTLFSQPSVSNHIMVAALESNITQHAHARFNTSTRFNLNTDDQDADTSAIDSESSTSIRLGVIGEEGERGWSLKPAIELNEPMVFKDVREAVQWADDKNQPKTEDTPIDKTLEKLGISHYQINLQAEYLF